MGNWEEEEAGCNFQVKNRKKKRGEWTSGITEGRREQINCSLAENTTASLLQSLLLALTPLGMSVSEGNTTDGHFSCLGRTNYALP